MKLKPTEDSVMFPPFLSIQHEFLPLPQGHSSFVTHLDWSVDSQYLVTNSGDYEILFCKSSVAFTFTSGG